MRCLRLFPIIALLAIGTACWLCRPSATARPAPDRGAPAQTKSNAELRFHPRASHRYIYRFSRELVLHGLAQNTQRIAYHGKIYLDVITADASGFDAIFSAKLVEHPDYEGALRIRLSAAGDKLTILTNPSANAHQLTEILKDLLANWAFPLTTDTVGRFAARFETLPDEDGTKHVSKSKLQYLRAAVPLPEIAASAHLLRWDDTLSLPRAVSGEEVTRMGSGTAALSSESRYAIGFLSVTAGIERSQALIKDLSEPETLSIRRRVRQVYDSGQAAKTWMIIARELSSIDRLAPVDQLRLFGKLVGFVRAKPQYVAHLVGLLKASDAVRLGISSALFRVVMGTLATVGTPEAQAAVVKIYQDPSCPVSGRGAILAALTTTQATLEPATREFLTDTMRVETERDLSRGAAFALGASLQNAPSDSYTNKAIDQIRTAWNATNSDMRDRLALLDVIGNSGRIELLPLLRETLESRGGATPLRARAVFALRFMPGEDAAQMLRTHLADSDPRIREAAFKAISQQAEETMKRRDL